MASMQTLCSTARIQEIPHPQGAPGPDEALRPQVRRRDPFRKCRDCKTRSTCRWARRILRRYLASSDFPTPGPAWPWEHGDCPLCVLIFPFEAQADCPLCCGAGEVAERKTRGTAAEGNQDWHDIGLALFRLPTRQRQAVEAWCYLGEYHHVRTKRIIRKLRTRPVLFRRRLCQGIIALAKHFREANL